jgi:hypothetical protein
VLLPLLLLLLVLLLLPAVQVSLLERSCVLRSMMKHQAAAEQGDGGLLASPATL